MVVFVTVAAQCAGISGVAVFGTGGSCHSCGVLVVADLDDHDGEGADSSPGVEFGTQDIGGTGFQVILPM